MEGHERLLIPAEVAALFRVDPKTVSRWTLSGKLAAIRTPGGQLRYRESEIRALLATVDAGPGSIHPTHGDGPPAAGPGPDIEKGRADAS